MSKKAETITEQPQPLQTEQSPQSPQVVYVEKEKIKRSIGFFGCIVIFFLIFLIISTIGIAIAWYGGLLQEPLCEVVTSDSLIGKELKCTKSTSINTENNNNNNSGEQPLVTNMENVVINVVKQNENSIVGIGINGGVLSQDRIVGSGFIVSNDGLIVTNQHVVSRGGPEDYFVVIGESEETIAVEDIYRDELNDIAIVKIARTDLNPVKLGDSDSLQVGQTVIAIGNPLGSLTSTVTVGTLSAQGRDVEVGDGGFNFNVRNYTDVLQTDAAINPGNSGGPLFNSQGQVIGINFATVQGADNLSFALPINRVKARIDEVGEFGSFRIPFLGVEYQRRLIFYKNESLVGAIVTRAIPGTPAEAAGLQEGDVIVQYDGKSLEDNALAELIQNSPIGEKVKVVIIREESTQTLTVTVGDRTSFE